ncbi:MAG: C40 family peptidase [Paracoccaceae bacterium]
MIDPRDTPRNDRVAADFINTDLVEDRQIVRSVPRQVFVSTADLFRSPDGARDRQLLFGDIVDLYEERDGWAFVQGRKDGYVGYLRAAVLGSVRETTHWVCRPATHVYEQPGFKSRDLMRLSFGSQIQVLDADAETARTPEGYIPKTHLRPANQFCNDPIAVAEQFLGSPYLWGGNSWWGIDCSGLVQAACIACGLSCPGDSDQQAARLGDPITGATPKRGDLLFWKGHVAWVFAPNMLLHASSHNMEAKFEPLDTVTSRIANQGDGPVIAHRRLTLPKLG